MIRKQHPLRVAYPPRSRFTVVTAIVLALCLGVSSAMAEPLDNGPSVKPPPIANVYVPPADAYGQQDLVTPDARDAGAGRLPGEQPGPPQVPGSPLPRPASVDNDGDSGPWLAIGLAAGGVVLLCGCAVGIRRTRRARRRVG
jgi:hypothetical protein